MNQLLRLVLLLVLAASPSLGQQAQYIFPSLSATNTWTGTNTFNGQVSFPGGVSGQTAFTASANGVDILSLTRFTDTAPTGNFLNFKPLVGASLFKVDILGNSTANTYISTVATGTAPLNVSSTTVVPNLNVSQLLGGTWASPGAIGSTSPNTGAFTTVSASQFSTSPAFNISTRGDRQIILQNPDFEGSTVIPPPGWANSGGTALSYETVSPAPGKHQSLKAATTIQFGGASMLTIYSIVPGDAYVLSCTNKSDGTGGSAHCGINVFNSSNVNIASFFTPNNTTNVWTTSTVNFTVPTGTIYGVVTLENNSVTQPSTVWFDQISVQKTNFPAPITTTGYQVNGAAPVNTFLKGNGTSYVSGSPVLASADFANQGTTTTVLHGNAAGSPSWAGVSLTVDTAANQGTTSTVLHGNAAGQPSFGSVVSADLNITTTGCTNQFVTAISAGGVGTCTTATLASAQFANQGTTTTVLHGNAAGSPSFAGVSLTADAAANQGTVNQVLHGNAAGQPSFGAVSLTADVSGILPGANGGTGVNSTAVFPTSGVVVTEAATETLTGKTYDTAGVGNVLKIGGGTVPATKGTANQVLAMDGTGTSLTFVTPASGNTTSVNLPGQTTNLGPTTIVGALGHTYLVQVYANQTVAGAAGSTTVNVSWTDSQGAKNVNVGTMSNTTVSAIVQASTVVFGANATNINYTISGVNGNTYDLHIRVTDWN